MEISRTDANMYIQEVLNIKSELSNKRIYEPLSDKAVTNLSSDFLSFVFSKEEVLNLFHSNDVNAIRIYLAAKPDSGKPSLVVVPCNVNENLYVANLLQSESATGIQYPITFSSNKKEGFDVADDSASGNNDDNNVSQIT